MAEVPGNREDILAGLPDAAAASSMSHARSEKNTGRPADGLIWHMTSRSDFRHLTDRTGQARSCDV